MAKSIGIFVTSPQNMRHVMGIAKAAKAKGAAVKVFLTYRGIYLTKCPDFPTLCEMADVSICAHSYKTEGFDEKDIPKGLTPKQMSSQIQHGMIVKEYDCYMTL